MALSYGGITLTLSTEELDALQAAYQRRDQVEEFRGLFYPGFNQGHLPFNYSKPPEYKDLGTLHWPRSASRFAYAHFVVSDRILQLIRPLAYYAGGLVPLALSMSDGTRTVTTNMSMLPPRPISQIAVPGVPGGSLWALTLVDDRYFWWTHALEFEVDEGVTTWADLYTQITNALGISGSFTADSISADFQKPTRRFTNLDQPIPTMFDAIAMSIGQQIVRHFDGTVAAQNYSTAKTAFDANWINTDLQPRSFGGKFYTDSSPATVSGDMFALVPSAVRVVFPETMIETGEVSSVYSIDNTLTGLTLPQFPSVIQGFAETQVLWGDQYALVSTSGGAPTNLAALTAYAAALSSAWYKWNLGGTDVVYAGVGPWTPEGITDTIEFSYDAQTFLTRVQRGPWNDRAGGGYIPEAAASSGTNTVELKGLTFVPDTSGSSDSNPGSGKVRWNNTTNQWNATKIFFNNSTADGGAASNFFASLVSEGNTRGYLYFQQGDDSSKWELWFWTAVTAASGYYKFDVSPILAHSTTGSTISGSVPLYTIFAPIYGFASATNSGIVNTTAQSFAGEKSFLATQTLFGPSSDVFISASGSSDMLLQCGASTGLQAIDGQYCQLTGINGAGSYRVGLITDLGRVSSAVLALGDETSAQAKLAVYSGGAWKYGATANLPFPPSTIQVIGGVVVAIT